MCPMIWRSSRCKKPGALRAGKKRLVIPKENVKDLDDVPAEVKENMTICPVSEIDEVFALALR